MRLFLAIDLPDRVKKQLDEQLEPLRKEYPQFTWIPKKNYHITVHFYGEIGDPKKLIEKLGEQMFDKEQFYLYAADLDLFINSKIIIFLNFFKEKRLLAVEKEIANSGNYIPHLTFCRCRIPSKQQYFVLKKRLEKVKIDLSFQIKELTLFSSEPHGEFPEYKKVALIPLIAP